MTFHAGSRRVQNEMNWNVRPQSAADVRALLRQVTTPRREICRP